MTRPAESEQTRFFRNFQVLQPFIELSRVQRVHQGGPYLDTREMVATLLRVTALQKDANRREIGDLQALISNNPPARFLGADDLILFPDSNEVQLSGEPERRYLGPAQALFLHTLMTRRGIYVPSQELAKVLGYDHSDRVPVVVSRTRRSIDDYIVSRTPHILYRYIQNRPHVGYAFDPRQPKE